MRTLFLFCLFVSINSNILAEEVAPKSAEDTARMKQRIARYEQDAKGYEFYKAGKTKSPEHRLKLVENPLMTYFNSSTGAPGDTHQGAFFLWTHRGRPEIISAIWSMGPETGTHGIRHEFHSLSTDRLAPVNLGGSRWAPASGVDPKPIPNAKPPSPKETVRLIQIRAMCREFTGFTYQPRTDGEAWQMRTESQPMFRYKSKELGILDGALVPIYADWDPDILLLIEAREKKSGEGYEWVYAPIRYNVCRLRLEYEGEEVWQVGACGFAESDNTYFLVGGGSIDPIEP